MFATTRGVKPSPGRPQTRLAKVNFRQSPFVSIESSTPFMLLSFARRAAICFCLGLFLGLPALVSAQTNYYRNHGTEYAVVGSLPGDQVFPDAALTTTGGFVVWQDNATDGSGSGVSARRLDGTLSGVLSTFRVNQQGLGEQEHPRVTLLKDGGAAFVWQGGSGGRQHIYARFLTATNTFLTTNDVLVDTFTNNFQINPAVTTLASGNVVVVWSSFNQAGSSSLQDVYGQMLSPAGQKVGGEFLVNQFTNFNQRTPVIAALASGGFVVVWVSEQQRQAAPNLGTNTVDISASAIVTPSVDIYARLYNAAGAAAGGEFIVNSGSSVSANPSVAAAADGTFLVAWGQKDTVMTTNSWDIFARSFTSAGAGGTSVRANSTVYGDQYAPQVTSLGVDYMVVWTSLGQDGSREGVYGRFMRTGGALIGGELRVNSTTASQQMHPLVASDGVQQFLVVWTSFTGSPYDFDLFAQRYANVSALLPAMSAPFVYAPFVISNSVYQPQLQVSWPPLLGISISNYEVYVNGGSSPMGVVAGNQWTMKAANGLTASSTNSFQVAYVTTDGRRAPVSPSASGTTWSGYNWGGVPLEWMTQYFGTDLSQLPSANADSDHDGKSNLEEFLSGTNPNAAGSVLSVKLATTPQGMFLNWNTQPGATYQVQVKTNFNGAWSNLGGPRFAAGTGDSVYVGGGQAGYYQVVLLR